MNLSQYPSPSRPQLGCFYGIMSDIFLSSKLEDKFNLSSEKMEDKIKFL